MVLNGAINEALRKHKESSELCLKASGKLQRRGDILSWASNVSSQMAPSLKYSHVTKPHLGWEHQKYYQAEGEQLPMRTRATV